jgi:hypothetical protein
MILGQGFASLASLMACVPRLIAVKLTGQYAILALDLTLIKSFISTKTRELKVMDVMDVYFGGRLDGKTFDAGQRR